MKIEEYYYVNNTQNKTSMCPPLNGWRLDEKCIGTEPVPVIIEMNIKELNVPPKKPDYSTKVLEPELMDILRKYHSEY